MHNFKKIALTLFIWFSSFIFIYADDHLTVNASVIIPKEEVDATLLEGLSRTRLIKEKPPHFSWGLF